LSTVVKEAAASAMRKAEGVDDGKVERRWMWQWTAALMADVAIDGAVLLTVISVGGGGQ